MKYRSRYSANWALEQRWKVTDCNSRYILKYKSQHNMSHVQFVATMWRVLCTMYWPRSELRALALPFDIILDYLRHTYRAYTVTGNGNNTLPVHSVDNYRIYYKIYHLDYCLYISWVSKRRNLQKYTTLFLFLFNRRSRHQSQIRITTLCKQIRLLIS